MSRIVKLAAIASLTLALLGCRGRNLRRAEVMIDAGDYESADRLLTQMLQRNPNDAEAHLLAGKALLLAGRTEEGDRRLEMAGEIDPKLKPRVARLYFDTGRRWFEGRIKPIHSGDLSEAPAPAAPPPIAPPPPPPPPPPAAAFRIVPRSAVADDPSLGIDERLRGYLQKAVNVDPQLAPAIVDWVVKTAKAQLDRGERAKALGLVRTAAPVEPAGGGRFVEFLIDGARTCAQQNDAELASLYLSQAFGRWQENVQQIKAAVQVLATMKPSEPAGPDSTEAAKRSLCQVLEHDPSLTRQDEDFAWLVYVGVFQAPGDYLRLFPNGQHAGEARSLSRGVRRGGGQSACGRLLYPEFEGGVVGGVIGSVSGGVPGGAPGGVIGGIIGGVPTEPPPPPPPRRETRREVQRIRVGGNVQQARLIRRVDPVYPPLARQARIQGVVRFTAVIGADGTVRNLQLVSGHPLLVPAAQEAVRTWQYQPTLLNGEPVEVVTQIDVQFLLGQ
ncbi:MAG: energy transducer TonB [Bryobacteraceae bacterium]|jgi:TonB family protein